MARLKIKKKLLSRSDRVKSVDLHSTEPWVLSSLYTGQVVITNYATNSVVKSFDVSETYPVRAAKFIERKQWIVCGSDDMMVRVYNYNTLDKEKQFEAHQDYIRSIAVHPSQPLFLTSSDDLTIKMWNWEKWECVRTFESHTHYVMSVCFNPKDPSTFASASLDHTVKVWSINSSTPNYTLEGHEKGVNYVEYYQGNDKPYLISGSDDNTAKVWDYQTKSCVQTLEGHLNNVSVCCFHPRLPFIITGSEDGTVNLWNASTYKLEQSLKYGLERVWAIAYSKDTKLALGYDDGTVVLKLGKEYPVVCMDKKGKIVLAIHNEIQQLTLKQPKDGQFSDGEKITLPAKDLGTLEVYPEKMEFDPQGRTVLVCGDGEFIIYNAVSFKSKTYGNAEQIVWGTKSGQYAIKERSGTIKVYNDFKEYKTFKPFFSPEQIFGGQVLGVRSDEFICLYDWDTCTLIRSIEMAPKAVYWNESGTNVIFAGEDSYYYLKYYPDAVKKALTTGNVTEDGVIDSIELETEVNEKVREGQWVGDCFIYINAAKRLNYFIGGQILTLAHLDKTSFYLGYVTKHNRVYLMDKEKNVFSYQLHLGLIQYQTAIVKGDLEAAEKILKTVPQQFYNQLGRFLHSQGLKEIALQVTQDPEHKFELALELGNLEVAYNIVKTAESEHRWRQLGGVALGKCDFKLAEECMKNGRDYSGLLLLYTSTGNREGVEELAKLALQAGKNNVAFTCFFLLHKIEDCIDLLCETGRIPEAAFLARSYMPSQVSKVVNLWKKELSAINESAAERLANPDEYPNLFTDWNYSKQVEEILLKNRDNPIPASDYPKHKKDQTRNLIEALKAGKLLQNGTIEGDEKVEEHKEEKKEEIKKEEEPKKEEESKKEEQKPTVEEQQPEKTEEPKPEEETGKEEKKSKKSKKKKMKKDD